MTVSRRLAGVILILSVLIGVTAAAQERGGGGRGGAQTRRVETGVAGLGLRTGAESAIASGIDPLAGPPVSGTPFSGETSTTVTQTLGDGTHIEQRATAKVYRDGTGRVRRELTIMGLDRLSPAAPQQTIVTFDSVPGDPMPYILDTEARVATRTSRVGGPVFFTAGRAGTVSQPLGLTTAYSREVERASNLLVRGGLSLPAASPIPSDIRPTEEQLGARQIEGVKATGQRTTTIIPVGRIGNDSPIRIIDEKWTSPELGITVLSRYSDPRTGVVEYKLTNINRTEPRADLFAVPANYTVTETPTLSIGTGAFGVGGRGTPAGQRGGRSN